MTTRVALKLVDVAGVTIIMDNSIDVLMMS